MSKGKDEGKECRWCAKGECWDHGQMEKPDFDDRPKGCQGGKGAQGKVGKDMFGFDTFGGKDKGFKGFGKVVTPNMMRQWAEELSQQDDSGKGMQFNGKGMQVGGKGKSWNGGKGDQQWDGMPGTESDVIREIHQQLSKPPHNKVYFDNWRERFGQLAPSPKEYMLMRPDLVELTFATKGNGFSVAWVGGDPPASIAQKRPLPDDSKGCSKGPKGTPGKKSKGAPPQQEQVPDGLQGTEDEALYEIMEQLTDPKNKQNKVFITDWRPRYGHLAPSYRAFMESRPDRFIVVPGKGASYTVELLDGFEKGGLDVEPPREVDVGDDGF